MTELKPILQGRPTRGELRLLGSARIDVPRPGGVARTVAALGLASGVTATAGVSAASASTASAVALVKWIAIGAAAGVVVTGTGEAVRYGVEANRPNPVVHQTVSGPIAPAQKPNAPRGASLPDVPAPSGDESNPAAAPASPRGPALPAASPPASAPYAERARESAVAASASQPTLAEEVTALDAVRRLLTAGDARRALRSLDDVSRKFTHPRLGPEAALLRAQAEAALGNAGGARRSTFQP